MDPRVLISSPSLPNIFHAQCLYRQPWPLLLGPRVIKAHHSACKCSTAGRSRTARNRGDFLFRRVHSGGCRFLFYCGWLRVGDNMAHTTVSGTCYAVVAQARMWRKIIGATWLRCSSAVPVKCSRGRKEQL
jgi:hypothetical protein